MYTKTSAPYYAHALYPLAQGYISEALQELECVRDLVCGFAKFRYFLNHPLFSLEEKRRVLLAGVRGGVHPEIERLILLLVERRKVFLLADIIAYLKIIHSACTNTVNVQVESAVELTVEEKEQLTNTIARNITQRITVEFKVRTELIAGFVVHIGGKVIDASVKGKFRRISGQLMRAAQFNQAR